MQDFRPWPMRREFLLAPVDRVIVMAPAMGGDLGQRLFREKGREVRPGQARDGGDKEGNAVRGTQVCKAYQVRCHRDRIVISKPEACNTP